MKDLGSTNGTFVNGRQVWGLIEIRDGDRLKVGPLEFAVHIEFGAAVEQPKPAPAPAGKAPVADEESIAAQLLALEGGPAPGSPGVDSEGVPTGSTEIGIQLAPAEGEAIKPLEAKKTPPPKPTGDTSSAAKSILDKYLKRPRK